MLERGDTWVMDRITRAVECKGEAINVGERPLSVIPVGLGRRKKPILHSPLPVYIS
jgi:hypothetical protein